MTTSVFSRWALLVAACVCLLATGCGSRFTNIDQAVIANDRPDEMRLDDLNGLYRIGPPDGIRITVNAGDRTEIETETTVRPDGFITFTSQYGNLHDVYVADKTPAEVADHLSGELAKYLKQVDVTVEVISFQSKKIYIFGEVGREGAQVFSGEISLVELIAGANAITPRSNPKKVLVVRGDPVDPQVFRINVKAITSGNDPTMANDILLEADDVIYVPPNIFAKIGYAIDNVLWPFRSVLSAAFTAASVQNIGGN